MQKRTIFISLLLIAAAALYTACDTGVSGDFNENQPPKTFLTINDINLPEGERLVSQVNISWWGDDPDGYIVGYEFRIGDDPDEPWTFTTRTDSTFVLPIEEGDQDADVRFTVRAVDNEGAVDPEPPSLVFPIRNSPPNISFRTNETPPDTTYRVFSFGFTASDPDGDANLNRLEIALNDSSSWLELDVNINFVTFRVDDTVEPATAELFLGRALNTTQETFDTIFLDDMNEFYVRAVDNAGAISQIGVHEWYIKRQTSNILFLNDFEGSASNTRAELHLNLLAELGFTEVDYIDISDGQATGGQRVPFTTALPARALAEPTINLMMAEWDHIYWMSNNLDRNIGYAIEYTTRFFDEGGTMFINMPTKNVPSDNPIFQFLPFQRMETLPTGEQSFFIANGSEIEANEDVLDNPPQLTFRRNLLSYYPIIPFGETVELFEADFQTRAPITGQISDFDGSKLISSTNPEENILFFGIDLTEFTEDSDLVRLLEITCIETLGFQQ